MAARDKRPDAAESAAIRALIIMKPAARTWGNIDAWVEVWIWGEYPIRAGEVNIAPLAGLDGLNGMFAPACCSDGLIGERDPVLKLLLAVSGGRPHFSKTALITPPSCAGIHSSTGLYSFMVPAICAVFSPRFR